MAKPSPEERAERKRRRLEREAQWRREIYEIMAGLDRPRKARRRKKPLPQGMSRLEVECKCGHRATMLLPAARVAVGITLRCSQCGAKRKM